MSKLYHVTWEFDMYIIADSEEEAEGIADANKDAEADNAFVSSIDEATYIDAAWEGCYPYGMHGEMTVTQWAKELGILDGNKRTDKELS